MVLYLVAKQVVHPTLSIIISLVCAIADISYRLHMRIGTVHAADHACTV
jgi:hypothetical protein